MAKPTERGERERVEEILNSCGIRRVGLLWAFDDGANMSTLLPKISGDALEAELLRISEERDQLRVQTLEAQCERDYAFNELNEAREERDALKRERDELTEVPKAVRTKRAWVELRQRAEAAESRLAELEEALKALVDDVLDYERINHLHPNPGRKYCWRSTEMAVAALASPVPPQEEP